MKLFHFWQVFRILQLLCGHKSVRVSDSLKERNYGVGLSAAESSQMFAYTWKSACAGSEQFIGVDVWNGLPPITERAVLWHKKGLVLLFTQQRKHMLHKLTQSAIAREETTE